MSDNTDNNPHPVCSHLGSPCSPTDPNCAAEYHYLDTTGMSDAQLARLSKLADAEAELDRLHANPNCARTVDAVPLPEGAAHAEDWEPEPGAPTGWSRDVLSRDQIGNIAVWAMQFRDGTIATGDNGPKVMIGDRSYPPEAARLLADALIDAADLAERWAGK